MNPTEWTVSDFKSIEFAALPLKRLTVLTGANSSGKSSLLQSLLLLGQSMHDEIVLNGMLVRLGEPADVIRSGADRVTVAYSATSREPDSDEEVAWEFSLELGVSASGLEVVEFSAAADGEPIVSATSSRVTKAARDEVNPSQRFGGQLLRVRELNGRRAPSRTYLAFSGFHPEAFIVRRSGDKVLADLRRKYGKRALEQDGERLFELYEQVRPWWQENQERLPDELVELYGTLFQQTRVPVRLLSESDVGNLDKLFSAYADAIAAEGWQPIPVARRPRSYRTGIRAARFLGVSDDFRVSMDALSIANEAIDLFRNSIRYLGPLREEPQVVSTSGGRGVSTPVGIRGEFTADRLARAKGGRVHFWTWDGQEMSDFLPEAVSLWTNYLGVGENVAVEDQGKRLFRVPVGVRGAPVS